MSPVQASCPACGAPVTFKINSSIVTVCEYCNSVVARGDRQLEDLGRVADLVDTGSPLRIGLKGIYRGAPFELVGRAQFEHEAGGIWDEWYAAFADGRWGWLAEAQGRFYMTFEQPLAGQALIPPFEVLELGRGIAAIPGAFIVAEKGVARSLGAKGEIPYRLVPGQEHRYADLSGPGGAFGTLDYNQWPPLLFIGREVSLAELGIPEAAFAQEREARRVAAVKLSCPRCGGPLELKAPDHAQRITCQNCGSLLDVNQGQLAFLSALESRLKPIIPLGSVGKFAEGDLTVIGFLQRSVVLSGVKYYWEEYLLYNPRVGFRWLVRSDDHWSYVLPVPSGEVVEGYREARFRGKRFKLFQDALASVEHVWGEFYWKVAVGETVRASDYICPPEMLSKEVSTTVIGEAEPDRARAGKRASKKQKILQTGEINWSLGLYMKPKEVEAAFGIKGLPQPSTIAPNQPFPHKAIYRYWGILMAAAFLLGLIFLVIGPRKKILEMTYTLQPLQNAEATDVIFTDQFELQSWRNIRVTAIAPVDNSWVYIEGDFINDSSGLVEQFSLPVEYYHGVEGGESWSEGGQSASTYLSALPGGKYTLRLEVSRQNWNLAMPLRVKVEQGIPRVLYLMLTLAALSVVPVLVLINHYSFERRRWEDSDYSPFEVLEGED